MNVFPRKHDHPNLTLLAVAAVVLRHLRKVKVETYSATRGLVQRFDSRAEPLLEPALLFLYGIGTIEYLVKTDSLVYSGD